MKYLLLTLLLLSILTPALAELSQSDLDKIQQIVDKSEMRMKEYIDLKIDSFEKQVNERFKSVDQRFNAVDKRLDIMDKRITDARNLGYALIALIGAIIGIPLWRNIKDDRDLKKQIKTLSSDIEALTQRVEMIEKQRIVN